VDDHQWLLSAKMISVMYVNFKLLIDSPNFYSLSTGVTIGVRLNID
jgi:hypothetical protein